MNKMKRGLALVAITVVAISATNASAAMWQGDINDLWSEGNNWTDDAYSGADVGVPTTATDVTILNPPEYSSPARVAGPGALANHIFLGKWTHPGLLTVDAAGTLAASGALIIADEVDGSGAVTNNGQFDIANIIVMQGGIGDLVNNGTLTASDIVLGNQTTSVSTMSNTGDMTVSGWLHLSVVASNTPTIFNMNGGTVSITGKLQMNEGGAGHLNLHGGTITMAEFGLLGDGAYTIDITEGVLVTGGDLTGGIDWMASVGLITAYGGTGGVVSEYNAGLDQTTMYGVLLNYGTWADGWGVDIGSETENYDGDLLDNLAEYGLGGDPTNSADRGLVPTLENEGGTMVYVHAQRTDDINLSYYLETTTDGLATPSWTNSGYSVLATNVTGGLFDYVTNTFTTATDETFLRLRIESN